MIPPLLKKTPSVFVFRPLPLSSVRLASRGVMFVTFSKSRSSIKRVFLA